MNKLKLPTKCQSQKKNKLRCTLITYLIQLIKKKLD